ncbi:MAG: hypothetical protein WBM86_27550, partial [Waterburya sp.]
ISCLNLFLSYDFCCLTPVFATQPILLLDGLDEVRGDRRNACVRAINDFIASHNLTETIVCSRVKDYEALSEKLQLSSAICLKPLSSGQVYSFLGCVAKTGVRQQKS